MRFIANLKLTFLLVLLSVLVGYISPTKAAQREVLRTHHYQVSVDKSLREAEVLICFDGKAPEYLVVDYRNALKNLTRFPQTNKGHIEFQGRYWKTKNLDDNACVDYKIDISNHLYSPDKLSKDKRVISFQDDNTWLWLPEKFADNETANIFFELPQNYRVSTPWRQLDAENKLFKIGKIPHDWGFTLIIGEFELKTIAIDNSHSLNLAFKPGLRQADQLQQWIEHTYQALINYLGEIPLANLQVILIENKRFKQGPVPWGDVKRGGGFGIRFVVNPALDIQAFYQDWTATHEFSHLLVPNIEYKDMWLSEGLASYLQYVLMAQSAQIDEQTAWQMLYQGLRRGEDGTQTLPAETLLAATKHRGKGDRFGRTMRIYWSGAAYFMNADWQLRKASAGTMGLADVLRKLNHCCVNTPHKWSGIALSKKLDALSGSNIFTELYRDIAHARNFPSTDKMFKDLGIVINDEVVILTETKNSHIRKTIMAVK